ncbi:class I SAM-dependent methyltransferase [Photobacterium lutimaris]|nr:class I SAM-dependent methyltransferase [Photobacterium lutimaris]TDR74644.1 methyltransferase family protein [Photobacterium lutimaris]
METVNYYTAKDSNGESIYDVWERGGALGNSITPSTYDEKYRNWMLNLILNRSKITNRLKILSLGCGNASIEELLVKAGHQVTAFDINEEAVQYAKSKGVDAMVCNLNEWDPIKESYDLVYCDGILGHLLDPINGFETLFNKILTSLKFGGMVMISNDASELSQDIQIHPDLPSFYWFSDSYLKNQLEGSNFTGIETLSYLYNRPLTGKKNRLIALGYKK